MTIREAAENMYDLMADMDFYEAADYADMKEAEIKNFTEACINNDTEAITLYVTKVLEGVSRQKEYLHRGYSVLADMFEGLAKECVIGTLKNMCSGLLKENDRIRIYEAPGFTDPSAEGRLSDEQMQGFMDRNVSSVLRTSYNTVNIYLR